jgi:hypothetical protein
MHTSRMAFPHVGQEGDRSLGSLFFIAMFGKAQRQQEGPKNAKCQSVSVGSERPSDAVWGRVRERHTRVSLDIPVLQVPEDFPW